MSRRHPVKSTNPVVRALFDYQDATGVTTKELAYRSGYAQAHISHLRRGKIDQISLPMVMDLAQALGGSVQFYPDAVAPKAPT